MNYFARPYQHAAHAEGNNSATAGRILFFDCFFIIGVSLLAFLPAFAADTPSCKTTCIDTQNLEIRDITLREGTRAYAIPASKTEVDRETCANTMVDTEICEKGGVVTCDESVRYVQFKYVRHDYDQQLDENLSLVNAWIENMGIARACSVSSIVVRFGPERIYARYPLISVVLFDLDYPRGAGGSCHGQHEALTFDTSKGGTPLSLADVVRAEDFPVLKAALLRELQGNHAGVFEDFEPEQRKQAQDRTPQEADDYLSTQAWKGGFFIERGMVHINIGRFLFDCATGNFNPVEVPDRFLMPEFLAVLKKAR